MILNVSGNDSADGPWDEIILDQFKAVNNTWGDTLGHLNQRIVSRGKSKKVSLRWKIKRVAEDRVHGFPHLLLGKHPWAISSTTEDLPARIDSISSIRISADWMLLATGKCNAAFDVWLSKGPPHSEREIAMEVMVWLDSRGMMVPHGKKVSVSPHILNKDVESLDLWIGSASFAGSRVPIVSFFSGFILPSFIKFDLYPIIKSACHAAELDQNDLWISAIELGSECVSGRGNMSVFGLSVDLA